VKRFIDRSVKAYFFGPPCTVVPYSIASFGLVADPGFLAVSLQVTLIINPVLGCRYFAPGPQLLPSQRDHSLGRYQIILVGDRDIQV